MQALKTLDLIDNDGRPTETFEGLRMPPEGEYADRLGQWLNNAYADVLKFVDPSKADETALRDAFRSYNPVGQQPRMVSLFAGLYGAAGIGPEKAGAPRSFRRTRTTPPAATLNNANGAKRTNLAASGSDEVDRPPPPPPLSGAEEQKPPPASGDSYRAAYSALSAVWRPGEMEEDIDAALVTLLRYLRMRETEPRA